MRKYFGTDGIRGLANRYPMTPDFFVKLGQVIGLYFKKQSPHAKIIIGKDTRRSGYMLEHALCSGLCSVGVDAYLTGPVPTPGIAYLTRGIRANAGIMLSASHNPYYDNGIKIFGSNGQKLPDSVELEIEAMLAEDVSSHFASGGEIGRTRVITDAKGQYAVFLKEQFPKHLTLDGIRIVIDPANGAAYKVAPKVLEELGAEVFIINDDPNGTNINDQCGALHPEALQKEVLKYRADMGIALDGDADRLIAVDEKGQVIDGDAILAICALDMIKKNTLNQNTVVATSMSNLGLEIALTKVNGKLIRTDVGDRYIIKEMLEHDYNFGGEKSGHLIFGDNSTTGDGLLAALKLLEVKVESNKTLSELAQVMISVPQVMENVQVSRKEPLDSLPAFKSLLESFQQQLGSTGRIIFRYSGTEKLARIMIEGQDLSLIKSMSQELADQLKKELS